MSSHTVTTSKSWFQRLGNSFSGIIVGIVLFGVGTYLLWWNEGNFVKTKTALNEAQSVVQELEDISKVDSAKNGQLVHTTGTAETDDILEDSYFGISTNAIRLKRDVQYYQWVEESKSSTKTKLGGGEETVTTYSYKKDWVASPVNSSQFNGAEAQEEHKNTAIAAIEDFSVEAENVTLDAYRLPKFLISSISDSESLTVELSDDVLSKLNQQFAPPASLSAPPSTPEISTQNVLQPGIITSIDTTTSDNQSVTALATPSIPRFVHVDGSVIYLGQFPGSPQIGDVRATFTRTKPSGVVSLVAKLNGDTFESFIARNGKKVGMLSMGTHSAENMFGSAHASNNTMTWILRVVGVFLVCISLRIMIAPLEVLASVIPFLGKLIGVGTGFFSLLFGAAWSLVIIALAWLFYRPLIGILILAVAAGLIYLLYSKRGSGMKSDKAQAVE